MRVVNRQGQELKVNQSQNRLLKLLYSHFLGRVNTFSAHLPKK